MKITEKQTKRRSQRDYSLAFKLSVIESVEKIIYLLLVIESISIAWIKPFENANPVNEHLSVSKMTDIKVLVMTIAI